MAKATNNGSNGGLLVGKRHREGGMPVIVKNAGNMPIEVEGGEAVITRDAVKKHWKLLSKINQDGGGVPIANPNQHDDDPQEEIMARGGTIKFRPKHVPKKSIVNFAEKVRTKYPEVWNLGGNIFGNEAFKNLKRVSDRGYWTDREEWMYVKWRGYVARHKKDFRIEGVIAMLKWCDTVEKGWPYMKQLIEKEIDKRYGIGKKMEKGGVIGDCEAYINSSEAIENNGHYCVFDNLKVFCSAYDDHVPPINSMVLITFNSGGQNNLKVNDTVNSVALASELSDKIGVSKVCARGMVYYYLENAQPVKSDIYDVISGQNVVIADRDSIVCSDLTVEMEKGGVVGEKVTKDNYYKETQGNFAPIKPAVARAIFNAYLKYRRLKNKPQYIDVPDFGKLKLDYESISKNSYRRSRGFSLYFLKGNSSVIRISDHWSESNYPKSEKLNCGYISSCYWTNFGEAFEERMPGEKYSSRFIAGTIKFSQLKRRQYVTYPKKASAGMLVTAAMQVKANRDARRKERRQRVAEFEAANPGKGRLEDWEYEAARSKAKYGYEEGGILLTKRLFTEKVKEASSLPDSFDIESNYGYDIEKSFQADPSIENAVRVGKKIKVQEGLQTESELDNEITSLKDVLQYFEKSDPEYKSIQDEIKFTESLKKLLKTQKKPENKKKAAPKKAAKKEPQKIPDATPKKQAPEFDFGTEFVAKFDAEYWYGGQQFNFYMKKAVKAIPEKIITQQQKEMLEESVSDILM